MPEHAIEIEITGIRPGEKLYEELFDDEETSVPMPHLKLCAVRYRPHSLEEVECDLQQLIEAAEDTEDALRETIQSLVVTHASSQTAATAVVAE